MTTVRKIRQVQLVGRKIRQLRKAHKLTQTELAERVGVQQSDLSRMEKGEYRVSLDTLFRILAEFKVTMGEFFDDVNKESLSPRDMTLMRHIKQLSREAQHEVETFVAFKKSQEAVDSLRASDARGESADAPAGKSTARPASERVHEGNG